MLLLKNKTFTILAQEIYSLLGKMLFSDASTLLLLCIFLPLLSTIAQSNFDLCRGKLRSLFRRRKPAVSPSATET